ncbi:alpha/beta fold hydrolase [Taklimakanibacter deserti]|uniref:alpha/beta fold hydrolase n=1 Tax=Taklimakanibacter deserti TaxID=2267839 RepID=UPI000E646931
MGGYIHPHFQPRASRRDVLIGSSVAILAGAFPAASFSATTMEPPIMTTFKTRDDVMIYFKDWGPRNGPAVVLCHGWPLSADSWDAQAFHLASNGYRVIVHDRRGHGRSSQPWDGNDMDHYADDLAQLIDHLGLRHVSVFGFSAGGGEVARFVGRHGTGNVAKLGLISAVTPFRLKTDTNPDGVPIEVLDGLRAGQVVDRAQFFLGIASGPFYGFNRAGATVSQGQIDLWWQQGMMAGLKNTYDCIAALSEDFRDDVRKFDRPTLVIHGDDDQIVPIDGSARAVARLLPTAELKIYNGAPHGLTFTHRERLNADLLDFLRS